MDEAVTTTPEPINPIPEDNVHAVSGGGKVPNDPAQEPEVKAEAEKTAPKAKKESVRESLEAAAKDVDKEPEKPKAEEKPAEQAKEKSAAPEKETDATVQAKEQQTERKSEVRERPEPPARFLPRAKELWRSTPNEVQSEVSRLVREHEEEVKQYSEAKQFREELREYEEMGRQHGISLKQALDNYVGIERKFAEDPASGFRQLFSNMNMQPQQAISHILRAYGIQPQQLAQHMTQAPHEYTALAPQRPVQPQQQVIPQDNPRIAELEAQFQEMRTQQAHQQFVEPFIAEHPRYYELEQDIAFFLQSGKIPANLSPAEKLAAAYDMAERINPSSNVEQFQPRQASPERRVDEDFNGTKSVKSSPGNVLDTPVTTKKQSAREMIEEELRRIKRA